MIDFNPGTVDLPNFSQQLPVVRGLDAPITIRQIATMWIITISGIVLLIGAVVADDHEEPASTTSNFQAPVSNAVVHKRMLTPTVIPR